MPKASIIESSSQTPVGRESLRPSSATSMDLVSLPKRHLKAYPPKDHLAGTKRTSLFPKPSLHIVFNPWASSRSQFRSTKVRTLKNPQSRPSRTPRYTTTLFTKKTDSNYQVTGPPMETTSLKQEIEAYAHSAWTREAVFSELR